jgi:hypothetical protein
VIRACADVRFSGPGRDLHHHYLSRLVFLSAYLLLTGTVSTAQEPVSAETTQEASISDAESPLTAEQKAEFKSSYLPVWEGYRSDISTGEIDYLFVIFTLKERKLTCDEFLHELRSVSLVPDETLARRLVERFCPEKLTGSLPDDEATLRAIEDKRIFRQQGNERRCVSEIFEHVVTGDVHLLADRPNKGVKAYRRGACNYLYETLEWFRTIPNESLVDGSTVFRVDADLWRLEYYGPASEAERKHASWLLLDQTDGLPRQWRMISPKDGSTLRMEVFEEMTQYPGDVLLPAVHLRANVSNGYVSNVRMTVIREARFNIALEEDAFRLSVPANWSWYDLQVEPKSGGRWTEPVADVAAFFRGRTGSEAPSPPTGRGKGFTATSWRPLLLILNGAVLIVIGVVLWRRSS